MATNCNCNPDVNKNPQQTNSMEDFIKAKQNREDQIDYMFVQRIIQELTQSCALNLPIPASAIPPLIVQAAQFFWANDDRAVEERWYCLPNREFNKCGPNAVAKLPKQIISVFGCYKTNNSFMYDALGDFSLERMIINNSALAAGAGGTLSDEILCKLTSNKYVPLNYSTSRLECHTLQDEQQFNDKTDGSASSGAKESPKRR